MHQAKGISMHIRQITSQDAAAYRNLRLEGLRNHPEAFSESVEEFAARAVGDIAAMIGDNPASPDGFILGAFDDKDRLVGVVSLARESFLKERHKAILWGMHVSADYRRRGIGRRLVEELVTRARDYGDIEQIILNAATRNTPAVRFYESLGFRSFGREPNALHVGDLSYDQEHMILDLRA
jgi:ribosomal protein S18 acetylase RimI-like enzyme